MSAEQTLDCAGGSVRVVVDEGQITGQRIENFVENVGGDAVGEPNTIIGSDNFESAEAILLKQVHSGSGAASMVKSFIGTAVRDCSNCVACDGKPCSLKISTEEFKKIVESDGWRAKISTLG